MKRVILAEGKNDTIFLRELLTTKLSIQENRILFFDQDSHEKEKHLKFIQDKYFERLISDWTNYDLLVKSEGGKGKIVGVIISRLPSLCSNKHNPIFLIDLDGLTMKAFTDDLEKKLTAKFVSMNLSTRSSELCQVDDVIMHSVELFKHSKPIGKIFVIGFHKSLECTTGISKTCSDEEKMNLSRNYIQRSHIDQVFLEALK